MVDGERQAGRGSRRRRRLPFQEPFGHGIGEGIVERHQHHRLAREVLGRVVGEAGTLGVVELLGIGVFPVIAPAGVDVEDIEAMLKAQGLESRGLLAGDVVYIYTGWGDNWKDPDTEKFYYTKGPGLSYDAAQYLASKAVVLVALDNPFTDPVAEGFLEGKAPPAAGTPSGLPFAIHHQNLTQAGIHNIQNANLGALAADKVWLSCTIILPLRSQGASGSPVRPVAVGVAVPR